MLCALFDKMKTAGLFIAFSIKIPFIGIKIHLENIPLNPHMRETLSLLLFF